MYGDDSTGKLENCPLNCLKCKDADSCEDCGKNKWDSKNEVCVENCDEGMYYDEMNFCKNCMRGCIKCKVFDTCLVCDKSKFYALTSSYTCEKKKHDKDEDNKDKNYRWYDNNKAHDTGLTRK